MNDKQKVLLTGLLSALAEVETAYNGQPANQYYYSRRKAKADLAKAYGEFDRSL